MLNGILLPAQLIELKDKYHIYQEYTQLIISSSQLLSNSISDILDYTNNSNYKITLDYKLTDIVNETYNTLFILRPTALKKNIEITVDTNINTSLYVDIIKFKQILLNLVSNSIKYGKQGGYIKVRLTYVNSIELIVTDDGYGMSKDFISRLFIPFSRDPKNMSLATGTGLGLANIKKIIDVMGGTITVSSEVNVGTVIAINIPTIDHISDNKLMMIKGLKIVYAEDNQDNARFIQDYLVDSQMIHVTNGHELVNEVFRIDADLVITDIKMPIMNGDDAIVELRQKGYTKPIIVTTANSFYEDIKHYYSIGADRVLSKPIYMNDLYNTITSLVN